jgi:hypothetical protein
MPDTRFSSTSSSFRPGAELASWCEPQCQGCDGRTRHRKSALPRQPRQVSEGNLTRQSASWRWPRQLNLTPERNSAAIRCVIPVVRVGCGTAGVYLLTCYPPKWGCHCEFSLSHILVVASGAMPMRRAENR